jgi:formylglycine-generating enzyme required for sulfatase activity
VINVNWNDAQRYVSWLSRRTGKPYRLLSEAEWEYAARAGSSTAYSWGEEVGIGNAHCKDCGSPWDTNQTAPVGSFSPNSFGLYDMHGNVWDWVQDCYQRNYNETPTDGSASTFKGDCERVFRGGTRYGTSRYIRSAIRTGTLVEARSPGGGFRVGRTLAARADAFMVAPGER